MLNMVVVRMSFLTNYRATCVWCGIVKAWQHIEEGLCWVIQDGNHTCFWKDPWDWVVWGSFTESCYSTISHDGLETLVSSYASENGWKSDIFQGILLNHIWAKIASIKPPYSGRVDFPILSFSSDGVFTIKVVYLFLSDNRSSTNPVPLNFSSIWRW